MTSPTIADITDAAVRTASRDLAVERGMARTEAQRSGPGTAQPAPKPAPVAPPAPAAPVTPPPKPVGWGGQRSNGWDHRPSSMAALDAARREREAKGRKP
jgi:hypothetical protein